MLAGIAGLFYDLYTKDAMFSGNDCLLFECQYSQDMYIIGGEMI